MKLQKKLELAKSNIDKVMIYLQHIGVNTKIQISSLASAVNILSTNMHRHLNKLEELGYIGREKSYSGRERIVVVWLTEKGAEVKPNLKIQTEKQIVKQKVMENLEVDKKVVNRIHNKVEKEIEADEIKKKEDQELKRKLEKERREREFLEADLKLKTLENEFNELMINRKEYLENLEESEIKKAVEINIEKAELDLIKTKSKLLEEIVKYFQNKPVRTIHDNYLLNTFTYTPATYNRNFAFLENKIEALLKGMLEIFDISLKNHGDN